MIVFETLTEQDLAQLLNNNIVGIFTTMFNSGDDFYDYVSFMCGEYYLIHSSNKLVSPAYINLVKLLSKGTHSYTPQQITGFEIRSKFINKWKKIYSDINTQYNIIDEFYTTKTKLGTNSENILYNSKIEKDGNNGDVKTFNTTVNDDSKNGTNQTVTTSENVENGIYGFNSAISVGDDDSKRNSTETTVGDKNENVTENTTSKTGTEDTDYTIDEEERHSGTDSKTFGINESYTESGRKCPVPDLISKDIEMRKLYNFFDIIYKDIDSIFTLPLLY